MKSIIAENVTEENRELRRAIRDLVALTAAPATWGGREPQQIAEGMADLLMSALRLDAAYVRLNHVPEIATEVSRFENWPAFAEWLKSPDAQTRSAAGMSVPRRVELPTGQGALHIAVTPIGMDAEGGLVAVGAQRPEFPTELETFLLSVVANQALISFQTARVLNERAEELERRVIERTRQLSTTNEELRKEFVDRQRAEDALQEAQAELAHVTRVLAMGELVTSIAHEVNQPLTAVVNNGTFALRQVASGTPNLEELREAIAEIVNDANPSQRRHFADSCAVEEGCS